MENISKFDPPNFGWLQVKLSKKEIDFLWEAIEHKGEVWNSSLAGNISRSNLIDDKDNWFFNNVLRDMMDIYTNEYPQIWSIHNQFNAGMLRHPLKLDTMWVNCQKKGEFNPLHHHSGKFSFVIFMKIPTEFEDQKNLPHAKESNADCISNFEFQYISTLGDMMPFNYRMGKWAEGGLLFFPSQLMHGVYPFYECDEDRITISGNLTYDTSISLSIEQIEKENKELSEQKKKWGDIPLETTKNYKKHKIETIKLKEKPLKRRKEILG